MVVLEKWNPKPISAIYFDGEKSAITSNAFFGGNENKESLSSMLIHLELFQQIIDLWPN
jgi:hypothetical protein